MDDRSTQDSRGEYLSAQSFSISMASRVKGKTGQAVGRSERKTYLRVLARTEVDDGVGSAAASDTGQRERRPFGIEPPAPMFCSEVQAECAMWNGQQEIASHIFTHSRCQERVRINCGAKSIANILV